MSVPALFKQSDISRAVKGVKAAGLDVLRVEVDREGRIVILIGNANETHIAKNEWDIALDENT